MDKNNNTFGEPLYITIAESLRRKIMGGEFNPGDLLPSENVLSTQYHTSRETVRKSLNILEKEGFIYSRAGKGSYISSPQHNVFYMSFSEDDSGNQTKYRNITVIEPSEEIRNALELNSSDKVIEISRVISRNGIPAAFDIKYIPYDKGCPIIENEINYSVFPEIVAAKTAPFAFCTQMEIGVESGDEKTAHTLQCELSDPLLVIYRYFIDQDGRCIGFGKKYMRQNYGRLKASSGYFEPC